MPNNWKNLSIRDKAAIIRQSVSDGIYSLKDIRKRFERDLENFRTNDANFVQRLRGNDTKYISQPDGTKATHLLSYATEGDHAIIFPMVQDNSGTLEYGTLDSAIERGDTVRTSIPFAEYYTRNYKKDYPEYFNRFEEGGNLFSGKDKNQPTQKLKRVDIQEWFDQEGNRNRPVNVPAMEQLQDSLIARGWGLPQRLAIMATAAQEMDERGAASRGVGGNGYLGLSSQRMPESYLDDSPEGRGKQIHYLFEDLLTTHSDNWLNGGAGGPRIMNGQDGYNQFWNGNNVYETTQVLNKSYIRPAGRLDSWNNRAGVAKAMQRHMYDIGGFMWNPENKTHQEFAQQKNKNTSEIDTQDNVNDLSVVNTGQSYIVQKGDTLSKIARNNNMSLNQLLSLNRDIKNPDIISVGQQINLFKQQQYEPKERFNILENRETERNFDNIQAIKQYKHKGNYGIVDKDAQTLTMYSSNGEQLISVKINTGASNNDYNTKTYQDKNGKLIYGAGNNSTPAGITEISSIGTYHGVPSFQRARIGNDNKKKKVRTADNVEIDDTIASSMHFGATSGKRDNASNGCIRIGPQDLSLLQKYLGVGDRIYTLPQQEGSRFVLKDKNLSFVADNVYGKDKTNADSVYINGYGSSNKSDWDDYNITIDRTYQPLEIEAQKTGDAVKDKNITLYKGSLEENKKDLQKKLGLSSHEYNTMAMVAMGIAQQESDFASSNRYIIKGIDMSPALGHDYGEGAITIRDILKMDKSADSEGIAQIKYGDESDDMKKLYKHVGVTGDHNDVSNEAKAVIARLAYTYKNQYIPLKKSIFDKLGMSEEESLAYLYHGGTIKALRDCVKNGKDVRSETKLIKTTAERILGLPASKEVSLLDYSNKVTNYLNNFSYYSYK